MRNEGNVNVNALSNIFLKVQKDFSSEWLLVLEMYELLHQSDMDLEKDLLNHLKSLTDNVEIAHLVSRGLQLIT